MSPSNENAKHDPKNAAANVYVSLHEGSYPAASVLKELEAPETKVQQPPHA